MRIVVYRFHDYRSAYVQMITTDVENRCTSPDGGGGKSRRAVFIFFYDNEK